MSEKTGLRRVLHDGHTQRVMQRRGTNQILDAFWRERAILETEGVPCPIHQHSNGVASWSFTLYDTTYHLRSRPTPGARADGAIYLRDAYRRGQVVAEWRTPSSVRHWFAERAKENP